MTKSYDEKTKIHPIKKEIQTEIEKEIERNSVSTGSQPTRQATRQQRRSKTYTSNKKPEASSKAISTDRYTGEDADQIAAIIGQRSRHKHSKNAVKNNKIKKRRALWISISLALGVSILLTLGLAYKFTGLFSLTSQIAPDKNLSPIKLTVRQNALIARPSTLPSRFYKASPYTLPYPEDGVKGIYLSAQGMGTPEVFERNMQLLHDTALNAVVIDVKSDWGSITTPLPEANNPLFKKFLEQTFDYRELMPRFEKEGIYPIARITTFKDTYAVWEHPEWSFKNADGEVWSDASGQTFLNPFNKDVWAYVVDVAKAAAQAGFRDIQFDYVRFPEGFETFGETLNYDMGDYAEYGKESVEGRQKAITDFLAYAKRELEPYGVDVSADVFGYVTTTGSAPGIGQNYAYIAEKVDSFSAMIYPSHWSSGDFGLEHPDLEPYTVIDKYIQAELTQQKSVTKKPNSRPWLQAFTAAYLGEGHYKEYDAKAIEEQIEALAKHGIHEYLLWNALNDYPADAQY